MTEPKNPKSFDLVGLRSLEVGTPPPWFWSQAGGGVAYDGALRLFPYWANGGLASYPEWNSKAGWRSFYGELAPEWDSFGEDAFGVQYLISPGEAPVVAIFWSETGEVEHLGVGPSEFLDMVSEDPENTISLGFYRACVARYGELPLGKHFAMRVESALGGQLAVDNVVPMDALEHMRALAHIAGQLRTVPIGSPLRPT
jgi:hypothetical protein